MGIRVRGVNEMAMKIKVIASEFPDRVAAALYAEAQVELTESKKRVPVDTGTLRASGVVETAEVSGKRIGVTIGYGGAAETYALIVHEDLEAFHRVGQAKYLESVLQESRPYMAARLASRLRLDKK